MHTSAFFDAVTFCVVEKGTNEIGDARWQSSRQRCFVVAAWVAKCQTSTLMFSCFAYQITDLDQTKVNGKKPKSLIFFRQPCLHWSFCWMPAQLVCVHNRLGTGCCRRRFSRSINADVVPDATTKRQTQFPIYSNCGNWSRNAALLHKRRREKVTARAAKYFCNHNAGKKWVGGSGRRISRP